MGKKALSPTAKASPSKNTKSSYLSFPNLALRLLSEQDEKRKAPNKNDKTVIMPIFFMLMYIQ
jgi:hypothetical protein